MIQPQPLTVQTVKGRWFLRDKRNRIWDGEQWRPCGDALFFDTFKAAFKECLRIKALRKTS